MRLGLHVLGLIQAGQSSTPVAADLIAPLAIGYWDAANLASQTKSDASVPEVGDVVTSAANLADTATFSSITPLNTGPTLRADGTSHYWEFVNSIIYRFQATMTPADMNFDVFMVVRRTLRVLAAANTGSWNNNHFGRYVDNSLATDVNFRGSATVDGGSVLTNRDEMHDALTLNDWVLFRLSGGIAIAAEGGSLQSITMTGASDGTLQPDMDVAVMAVIPSATVATGTNLADIVSQLEARIAELNA